jgi:hypothetical protein
MTYDEICELLNTDPVVQRLLAAPIPARLAYVTTDGEPRVIPVSYLWNGKAFVFASPPHWTKIKSLQANPKVAFTVDTTDFPPEVMLVRGIASIELMQGVPEDYVEASRRIVGKDKMENWERIVREEIKEMALVTITPTWVKINDFVTRFPGPQRRD